MRQLVALAVGLVIASTPAARADEGSGGIPDLSPPRRALSITTALVPGVLVPGLGHFVAGEPRGGRKILLVGGIGFGSALVGAVGLAASGASPRTVTPLTFAVTLGAGAWLGAVLADLYGVSRPAEKSTTGRLVLADKSTTGRVWATPPAVRGELGVRYVHDPTFDYRLFSVAALDLRRGRARLSPSAWVALDDDNQRFQLTGAWRLLGKKHDRSFFEIVLGATYHRYGSDAFTTVMGELSLGGRLDLDHLSPSLRGSFGELSAGLAVGAVRYHDVATEETELLLASSAFGIYVGRGGEVAITYDHRHDGFAAGMKLGGVGSGPAGHFGLRALVPILDTWAILADFQVGSAYVGGVSVVFRQGGSP